MAATFYTLLTKFGQAAVANATALNTPVNLTKMAVGDGGGAATTPKETQTTLIAQKYIANINQLTIDTSNPNYLIAEMIVPTTVGGWYVREVGIFDAAGNLFAVANFPETYKPQLAEGSGRDLAIRIVIQVSNASAVTLLVDPAVTLASQSWVISNFVSKSQVSGGATGEVLAKSSADQQDFTWKKPTDLIDTATTAKKGIVQLSSTLENNETKAATPKMVLGVNAGRLVGFKAFGGSVTYTPGSNVKTIKVILTGGGASGGKQGSTTVAARSGGAGGTVIGFFPAPAGPINITIGMGGTGVTVVGAAGTPGGDSTFGTLMSAKGGTTDNGKGGGGDSTVGAFTVFGGNGNPGSADSSSRTFGGASYWGGGGSGITSGAYIDASAYGSGGAGVTSADARSGSGAQGICVIEEYS